MVKFISLKNRHKFALGASSGVFVALTPSIPIQTPIAIGLAALLRGNLWAAAVAVWLNNPITCLPIYYFNMRVGAWALGFSAQSLLWTKTALFEVNSSHALFALMARAWDDIAIPLIVGSLIIACAGGAISYMMSLFAADLIYSKYGKSTESTHELSRKSVFDIES